MVVDKGDAVMVEATQPNITRALAAPRYCKRSISPWPLEPCKR